MSAENAEFSCRRYRFIKPQTFFMVNRSLLIKSGRKRSAVFSLKKDPHRSRGSGFCFFEEFGSLFPFSLRQYCRSIQISEVLGLYFCFSSFGALFPLSYFLKVRILFSVLTFLKVRILFSVLTFLKVRIFLLPFSNGF